MDSTPFPGMLVGSNVRLLHQLGSGGMASIWVATHLGLQIHVAVKFLAADLAAVPEARARFEREAAAAAQLKNPHVVQVFDRGVTETGMPYIVMELLAGEDLNDRIERLGPRPLAEVVALFAQVARALSSAHAQGIVHRDIKPENVFLVETDTDIFVKLLDFGIAKRVQDGALGMTSANIMLGTPYFMSPEQVTSAKDVDFRTDLWSVAVVAYSALTAKLPFEGETLGGVCIAINAGRFTPVTQLRPDLPFALDSWFTRAFQRNPLQRFRSVHEMAAALELAAEVSAPRVLPQREPSSQAAPLVHEHPTVPGSYTPVGLASARRTFAGASITQGEHPKQNQWLMVATVVLTSMVSSAVTTVLFLAPSSLDRLVQPFTRGPEPNALGSALPAPSEYPRSAPSASSVPPLVVPASSAEIRANTPERDAPRVRTTPARAPRAAVRPAPQVPPPTPPAPRIPDVRSPALDAHEPDAPSPGDPSQPGAKPKPAPDYGL